MKTYSRFLTEAQSSNEPNKTHITHFEDVVFYRGYKGVRAALDLAHRISSDPDSVNISEKFDGAPTVFFGPAPVSGEFFVATKGIFNKKPVIYKSVKEIEDNVKKDGLAKKLVYALHYLRYIKPTEILQGDMLFIKGDVKTSTIKGDSYLLYHPNTLVYGVEAGSKLAHDIIQAKVGIVLHTKWSGDSLESLTPTFNVARSDYEENSNVFIHDPTYDGRDTIDVKIGPLVKKALALAKKNQKHLDRISGTKGLGQALEQHHNLLVRKASINIDEATYVNSLQKFIKEKKPRYVKSLGDIKSVIQLHDIMEKIKDKIYKHLNKRDSEITAFVREKSNITYESDIEGFVANRRGQYPLKFVNRIQFARHNFNDRDISKGWEK